MTIYYKDEGGIVAENLGAYDNEIDFCDGSVYFLGADCDENGDRVDRKIPLSALVRITE